MNKNVFHMAVQLQSKKANLLMTIEKKNSKDFQSLYKSTSGDTAEHL